MFFPNEIRIAVARLFFCLSLLTKLKFAEQLFEISVICIFEMFKKNIFSVLKKIKVCIKMNIQLHTNIYYTLLVFTKEVAPIFNISINLFCLDVSKNCQSQFRLY